MSDNKLKTKIIKIAIGIYSLFIISNVISWIHIAISKNHDATLSLMMQSLPIYMVGFICLSTWIYIKIMKKANKKRKEKMDSPLDINEIRGLPQGMVEFFEGKTRSEAMDIIYRMNKKPKIKAFVVNKYITLKFKRSKTKLYVGGKPFRNCMYLMMNIDKNRPDKYEDIHDVDDMNPTYDIKSIFEYELNKEQIFIGHCSNIQTWVENNYDTRILHRNLSFPLLKKLTELGDPKARNIFAEEIVSRYLEGNENVRRFLNIEGYLQYLEIDQLKFILSELLEKEAIKNRNIIYNEIKNNLNEEKKESVPKNNR